VEGRQRGEWTGLFGSQGEAIKSVPDMLIILISLAYIGYMHGQFLYFDIL